MKLVFLGCGASARAHARRLRGRVELGFASREPARAAAFARELGGTAYDSYEAALAAAVDAVVIATPPATHLPLALAALAAGKHVVLDKPALAAVAEFAAVEAAAAAAGRRVFVAENYRYKPVLARLQQLLAERVVGDVVLIAVNAVKHQVSHGWRADEPALHEGGIHWVDFMAALGEIRSARGVRAGEPERSTVVTFAYAGGAIGTLAHSWEVPSLARGLRLSKIYGRAGTITFESNGLWVLCRGTKTRFYVPDVRDLGGHRAMWSDFLAAWRDGTEPRMTLALARRDQELIEEAYR